MHAVAGLVESSPYSYNFIEDFKMNKSKLALLVMALTLLISSVIPANAEPGAQNGDSLSVVQPKGGAYVIVTRLATGRLDFKYGWNNSTKFDPPAAGYWIGVYDNTASHYMWSADHPFIEPAPKLLKLSSQGETELTSGHNYTINFFVRGAYSPVVTNTTEVQVTFDAP